MNDLISIIIPAYNSELYLYDCIQSILHQTYSDFEVILADDGSCEDSRKIYEKISRSDQRILLFQYGHRGVSAARNAAIKAARGKYIFFMDSDDIIHPHLLESLYCLLKKTSSILATTECLKFKNAALFNKNYLNSKYSIEYTCIDTQTAIDLSTRRLTQVFDGIGGIMVLRSAIRSLLFDETLICGEDTKFIYQLLLQNANVIILHHKWYYYRRYEFSDSKRNTLEACKSIYSCDSYIRNSEFLNNRLSNAKSSQICILNNICKWYVIAKKKQDQILQNYLIQLAKNEKKSDLYAYSRPKTKRALFLMMHCFPIYTAIRFLQAVCYSVIYRLCKLIYLKRLR